MKMDQFSKFEDLRRESKYLRQTVDTLELHKKFDHVVIRVGDESVIITKKEYNRMITPIIKRLDQKVTDMIAEAESL